jgi:hypothetical protein
MDGKKWIWLRLKQEVDSGASEAEAIAHVEGIQHGANRQPVPARNGAEIITRMPVAARMGISQLNEYFRMLRPDYKPRELKAHKRQRTDNTEARGGGGGGEPGAE